MMSLQVTDHPLSGIYTMQVQVSKPRVRMLLKAQSQVALTKAMTEFGHVPPHEATRDQEATKDQGVNGLMPKPSS
jgi:hypothetical protein